MKYILAIGTNLGERLQNIKSCIKLMEEHFELIKISSIYETSALLIPNSPKNWDIPYYNCALSILVPKSVEPLQVLAILKRIESKLGRDKVGIQKKWAPRVIDIDIILAAGIEHNSAELTIPHPEFLKRDFVIVPIKEIESNFYIEKLGKYVRNLECNSLGSIKRVDNIKHKCFT